jgi:hypothetical protein
VANDPKQLQSRLDQYIKPLKKQMGQMVERSTRDIQKNIDQAMGSTRNGAGMLQKISVNSVADLYKETVKDRNLSRFSTGGGHVRNESPGDENMVEISMNLGDELHRNQTPAEMGRGDTLDVGDGPGRKMTIGECLNSPVERNREGQYLKEYSTRPSNFSGMPLNLRPNRRELQKSAVIDETSEYYSSSRGGPHEESRPQSKRQSKVASITQSRRLNTNSNGFSHKSDSNMHIVFQQMDNPLNQKGSNTNRV